MLTADADRRRIERDLHDGLQQQLVALAANLQLARSVETADPALLDDMARDVQQAIDEAGKLAHRIYPPLLEAGGLLAALRATAMVLGVPARVEVTAERAYPPEIASTVYFCCVEALERAGAGATVDVRDQEGALAFEVVADRALPGLEALRDRVEALAGSLTIREEPSGGTRVSGSLPLSR